MRLRRGQDHLAIESVDDFPQVAVLIARFRTQLRISSEQAEIPLMPAFTVEETT